MEQFGNQTRSSIFVKMVPIFSSMGPEPVTQSNKTRERKPKKTFLRNNTGSRKSYWSGLVFLTQGLIPTCCNQLSECLWGHPGAGAPRRRGTFYICVWLGSLPGAKFKVQFPVICWDFSVGLIGQDRSLQAEVIFPDFCHFLRREGRFVEGLGVGGLFVGSESRWGSCLPRPFLLPSGALGSRALGWHHRGSLPEQTWGVRSVKPMQGCLDLLCAGVIRSHKVVE